MGEAGGKGGVVEIFLGYEANPFYSYCRKHGDIDQCHYDHQGEILQTQMRTWAQTQASGSLAWNRWLFPCMEQKTSRC